MSEEYRFNSYEEAMKSVKLRGRNIKFVREDLITPEMALVAVKYNGWNLQHIPPDLITPEMALVAVAWSGWTLQYVPAHCQTKEVIEMALRYLPHAKRFIKVKEIFKNALGEALDE